MDRFLKDLRLLTAHESALDATKNCIHEAKLYRIQPFAGKRGGEGEGVVA